MKAKGCKVYLFNNTGFTLPSNISELGDDIVELDLSGCSLQGPCMIKQTQKVDERKWGETSRNRQGTHAERSLRVPLYRRAAV